MQQKRIRGSKPKVFRCTGFGDCNMVFTRSEHLARHSRKHTGEKPFKCIVPYCNKAFSRFDNMMQHTQTHRNHPNQDGNKKNSIQSKLNSTRSSTRAQTRNELQVPPPTEKSGCRYTNDSRSLLSIKTMSEQSPTFSGLASPPSSLPSPVSIKYELSSDEDEEMVHPSPRPRRLSVADLCNPPESSSHDVHLTRDEFEALEGFGRFRHTPTIFFTRLRNLASNIDHY